MCIRDRRRVHGGIVVCGSGIGISMACNKVKGIRCAVCHDYFTAHVAKAKMNCNMISMGDRVVGLEVAKQIVDTFLNTKYENTEENNQRLLKLEEFEKKNLK
eukprot:TRINITY_DN7721_c0_g1_i1.p1 TRINITY_DN7721_c0_g1~~TRINITY_DN7721_c0_g1_i1.p1  ORF type:complete len:102 (+),score=23.33 TRINITY_DN7721_c0_g1_i1:163-468(+)